MTFGIQRGGFPLSFSQLCAVTRLFIRGRIDIRGERSNPFVNLIHLYALAAPRPGARLGRWRTRKNSQWESFIRLLCNSKVTGERLESNSKRAYHLWDKRLETNSLFRRTKRERTVNKSERDETSHFDIINNVIAKTSPFREMTFCPSFNLLCNAENRDRWHHFSNFVCQRPHELIFKCSNSQCSDVLSVDFMLTNTDNWPFLFREIRLHNLITFLTNVGIGLGKPLQTATSDWIRGRKQSNRSCAELKSFHRLISVRPFRSDAGQREYKYLMCCPAIFGTQNWITPMSRKWTLV